MIRTNASPTQTRPQPQEGFFSKIGRVLKETFATPQLPAQKLQTTDTYRLGQPLSRSAELRLKSLTGGASTQGANQRRAQLSTNYTQADYIAMCDSIARLNETS